MSYTLWNTHRRWKHMQKSLLQVHRQSYQERNQISGSKTCKIFANQTYKAKLGNFSLCINGGETFYLLIWYIYIVWQSPKRAPLESWSRISACIISVLVAHYFKLTLKLYSLYLDLSFYTFFRLLLLPGLFWDSDTFPSWTRLAWSGIVCLFIFLSAILEGARVCLPTWIIIIWNYDHSTPSC